jgi:hypothetical protein
MFNLHCVVIKAGGLHKARPLDFILTKTSFIVIEISNLFSYKLSIFPILQVVAH